MSERGDKKSSIKARLNTDVDTFNVSNIEGINFVISSQGKTIEQVADEIYNELTRLGYRVFFSKQVFSFQESAEP